MLISRVRRHAVHIKDNYVDMRFAGPGIDTGFTYTVYGPNASINGEYYNSDLRISAENMANLLGLKGEEWDELVTYVCDIFS